MKQDRSKEEQKAILTKIQQTLASQLTTLHAVGLWETRVGLKPNDEWGIVVKHAHDDGAVDVYRVGHNWASGDRLVIDAKLDHNIKRYNETAPSATVRDDRGARAVAQALVKRVLPDAGPMFDRERSVIAARDARKASRVANAKRLSTAAGVSFRTPHYDKDEDPFLPVSDWHNVAGSISVGYEALKLDIRVDDMDLAAEILAVIRAHAKRGRTDTVQV